MSDFAQHLIRWQKAHGRHNLPWQGTRDAYRIWLSEIMLQQTQVGTVIPYYLRFLERFPNLARLADAPLDEVLALWSGLGYYSRGRNLHAAARLVMERHGGAFPEYIEDIIALPGIGRSTAAAIAAFAYGAHCAILDGNVKRVLTRHFGIAGHPGAKKTETELWLLAESLLPAHQVNTYTQALMDFGATLCTRAKPRCASCPLGSSCVALATDSVARLPTSRPKKITLQKTTRMLILRHAGEILLEKRPPTGIWGGLWSLPEADMETDLAHHCRTHLGMEVATAANLPALRHSFTHFRLHIAPLLLDVTRLFPRVEQAEQLWLAPRDALSAAIPAAVRKLLQQLVALEAPG
ncbi:A/G-specific adenine glycosylase [Sulfuriferula plumbiphila]|uniref:Adenine DNA glycosylase n=1 Tax=Sulfuriferula plumbiphila TaxID=171865 RepID=A0A512L4N1_9PROT|nr:A/G-specific adenine glycosylase [Sulfuriferula plumbiphila]BBP03148.1 A/G-specific adenine glycosylase [Sulfuriferula plumbiphila]GEP29435.1 A/G-specific adenine glycosylase [Sulfuriferula plumbiphila]